MNRRARKAAPRLPKTLINNTAPHDETFIVANESVLISRRRPAYSLNAVIDLFKLGRAYSRASKLPQAI